MIDSPKLWYTALIKEKLDSYVYIINLNNLCVFKNKVHNGDQVTVTFYVDDLLTASINEVDIDELISNLSRDFEC